MAYTSDLGSDAERRESSSLSIPTKINIDSTSTMCHNTVNAKEAAFMRLFLYLKFKEFNMNNATLRDKLHKIENICSLGVNTNAEYGLFSSINGIRFYPSFQYLLPTAGQAQLAQSYYLCRDQMIKSFPHCDIDRFDFFFFSHTKTDCEQYKPELFFGVGKGFSELLNEPVSALVEIINSAAYKAQEDFAKLGEV